MQAARRATRLLFRPAGAGWRRCADDLRTRVRLLHRPDREEAAEPLLSRHERVVVRDSGLQPRLPVLPELGHLESAREGPGKRLGITRTSGGSGGAYRLAPDCVHRTRTGGFF